MSTVMLSLNRHKNRLTFKQFISKSDLDIKNAFVQKYKLKKMEKINKTKLCIFFIPGDWQYRRPSLFAGLVFAVLTI